MEKNKFYRPFRGLLVLIHKYYWKSFSGPFFTFVFPIIFVAIIGWLLGYYMILGGALAISAFSISLTSMPQAIYEFKSSTLLKRIGATPIKPYVFVAVTGIFYVFMMLISVFWTMLMSFIIFAPNVNIGPNIKTVSGNMNAPSLVQMFGYVNWGGFIISQLLTIVIGVSCGMMLVSIARSSVTIQAFGIIVMIVSMLLSACLFPPYLIRREGSMGLWWIGYFVSPFKSTTNMMTESWFYNYTGDFSIFNINNSTIFDCSKSYEVFPLIYIPGVEQQQTVVVSSWEKILDWFLPFIWIGLFASISIFKFRWTTK